MHTALSLILLVTISLQAMVGCCCRAAQFCGEITGRQPAEVLACCDHDHAEHGTDPHHPPGEHCPGCDSVGVYIAAPKTMLDKPDTSLAYALPGMASVKLESGSALTELCQPAVAPVGNRPLYLLRQLLLL